MKLVSGRKATSKQDVRTIRGQTMEHWTRVMSGTKMILIMCDYLAAFSCSAMLSQ